MMEKRHATLHAWPLLPCDTAQVENQLFTINSLHAECWPFSGAQTASIIGHKHCETVLLWCTRNGGSPEQGVRALTHVLALEGDLQGHTKFQLHGMQYDG